MAEKSNGVPVVDISITPVSPSSLERVGTGDSDMGLLEPLKEDLQEWDDISQLAGNSLFQQKLASIRSRVLESRHGTPVSEPTIQRPGSPTTDEMLMLQTYHHSLQSLAESFANTSFDSYDPIRRVSSTPTIPSNGRFSPVPRPSSATPSAVSSNGGVEEELLGLLTLEIVSASDLPQGGDFVPSMIKSCNPFVVVSFGKQSWRTPYAKAYDRYPTFEQTYHIPIHTGAEVERDSITISVYIWNYLRRNLLVGTAELKVATLLDSMDCMTDRKTVSTMSDDFPIHGRWTPDFVEDENAMHQSGEATSLFDEGVVDDDDENRRTDLGEPFTPKLKEFNIALNIPPTALHAEHHKPHVRLRIGWSDHHQLLRNLCLYLFDVHDSDGNGRLNRFELEAVLETAGANLSQETQDAMFLNRGQDPETGDLDIDQLVQSMEEVVDHVLSGTPLDVASADSQSIVSSDEGSEEESPQITGERVVDIHHCPMCRLVMPPGQRSQLEHLLTCCSTNPTRDSPTSNSLVGFLTEEYASRKWITKVLRRWGYGKYVVGGRGGHVLVLDRRTGRVREELLPTYVNVGIRLMYQNYYARTAVQSRALLRLFKTLTLREGRRYSHPKSVKKIPGFIKRYRLDLNEIRDPLSSFQTFNEFFARKLKPGARPCAFPNDSRVAVSCADSRVMVFPTVNEATRLWIKGENFSVESLIGDDEIAGQFWDGSLAIFRLAPQDYHRFHFPVDGTIVDLMPPIGTNYFTVNPMAIRSPVDVLTTNLRQVLILDSPEFGKVAMIAVGAMLVGSIRWTCPPPGSKVSRMDEAGYFEFGGSTVILLFERDRIRFEPDLVQTTEESCIETLVRVGEVLGIALHPTNESPE